MPRKRRPENEGLPNRWRFTHGSYFYQVPPGHEPFWGGKQLYRLGSSFDAALDEFARAATGGVSVAEHEAGPLLPAEAIVASARATPRCGVYFLVRNGEVVYVGRSENLLARLAAHASEGRIQFDSHHVIAAEGFDQERLEQLYIATLRPRWNVYRGGKEPRE